MADAQTKLGQLVTGEPLRDAVHIAVAPVEAGSSLLPGEHVHLRGDKAFLAHPTNAIGIVDPFLVKTISPGDKFWLFLYPNTITSLKHVWEHPAFAEEKVASVPTKDQKFSEQWLRDFLDGNGPDYDQLIDLVMGTGTKGVQDDYYYLSIDGDYLHCNGTDAHGEIPAEFWDHVEVVTGKRMDMRPSYFSCSC
jgi:hypothetical protein